MVPPGPTVMPSGSSRPGRSAQPAAWPYPPGDTTQSINPPSEPSPLTASPVIAPDMPFWVMTSSCPAVPTATDAGLNSDGTTVAQPALAVAASQPITGPSVPSALRRTATTAPLAYAVARYRVRPSGLIAMSFAP